MTIPQEHIDQMLSGYLDDALTADQRAEVEQWIDTDPAIANQWAESIEIRKSLRLIAKEDRNVRLDPGFAGRVLEAAVARARSEGVGEDHPLVRLSEQPTSVRTAAATLSWRRVAGIVVATAASVGLVVFSFSSDRSQPELDQLAIRSSTSNRTGSELELKDSPRLGPSISNDMVASGDADSNQAMGGLVLPNTDAAKPMLAEDSGVSERLANSAITTIDQPKVDAIANVMTESVELNPPSLATSSPGPATPPSDVKALASVIVFDVRQTSEGRLTGAVRRAMRAAQIEGENEKMVNAEIAAAATNAVAVGSDDRVSLFYLQAPAKRIDRFYLSLFADREGVESVGMTIAVDPPIMKAINEARQDPTTIRHDAMVQLPAGREAIRQLASRVSELNFVPVDPSMVGGIAGTSGPDIEAQILVLVR